MVTIYDMAAGVEAEAGTKKVSSYSNLLKGAGARLASPADYIFLKNDNASGVWVHFTPSEQHVSRIHMGPPMAQIDGRWVLNISQTEIFYDEYRWGNWKHNGQPTASRTPTVGLQQIAIHFTPTSISVHIGGKLEFSRTSGTIIYDNSSIYISGGDTTISHAYSADEHLPNAFVEVLRPNGNGVSSDFVGSDGDSTNNFELIDEATPSATDYVGTALTGKADFYTLTDLGATVSEVFAVKPQFYGMASDAGTAPDTDVVFRESGGATSSLPLSGLSAVTMAPIKNGIKNAKPSGGAWSKSVVDAMQLGLQT